MNKLASFAPEHPSARVTDRSDAPTSLNGEEKLAECGSVSTPAKSFDSHLPADKEQPAVQNKATAQASEGPVEMIASGTAAPQVAFLSKGPGESVAREDPEQEKRDNSENTPAPAIVIITPLSPLAQSAILSNELELQRMSEVDSGPATPPTVQASESPKLTFPPESKLAAVTPNGPFLPAESGTIPVTEQSTPVGKAPVLDPKLAQATKQDPLPTAVAQPARSSIAPKPQPVGEKLAEKVARPFSLEEPALFTPPRAAGTDAARHQPRMPIAQFETKPLPNPLDAAIISSGLDSVVPCTAIPIQRSFSGERSADSDSFAQGETGQSVSLPDLNLSISSSHTAEPAAQESQPAPVTHVLHEVVQAIERLRTDGHSKVEIQIRLHDGEQLTVRLQMRGTEVRTVFKTDSTEWREAIGRGWADFSSNVAERGIRVTTPVFQSPTTHQGLNDFNQRQEHQKHAEFMDNNPAPTLPKRSKSGATPSVFPSPAPEVTGPTPGLAVWA